MLDSQSNMQKSESPPSDTQNQEPQITKASGYEFPVFTSVEQTPQITTSHDLLNANDPKYNSPDGVLNPKTQSNDSPVDPLYDPLSLNSVAQRDDALRSPVVEYDKLNHSPTPQRMYINQYTYHACIHLCTAYCNILKNINLIIILAVTYHSIS